jgi:23S rRNA pseudouridine2605 synthase
VARQAVEPEQTKTGERIAKVIARAGVCSRRDAEKLIEAGRVSVDGKPITSPALNVSADAIVLIDGKPIPSAGQTRLWRYHKPQGLVTSHRDPEGRPTVFASLPPSLPRVVSVGRLDINSEGLLLLTNDGELARRLELPAQGWVRRYRARVHGDITQRDLDRLANGITVEGVRYGPVTAELERTKGHNSWVTISLKEGKNREVKRLMEHLGLKVARLIRVSFGPFHLGHLAEGQVDEIPGKVWREQLGMQKPKRPLHPSGASRHLPPQGGKAK